MKISREFQRTFFEEEMLRECIDFLRNTYESEEEKIKFQTISIKHESDDISFDSNESGFEEFLGIYSSESRWVYLSLKIADAEFLLTYSGSSFTSSVEVKASSKTEINKILRLFSNSSHKIVREISPEKPKIFLGHGRSSQWKELKDHLVDQHGMEVIAYETGARAGHTIRDILEEMSAKSTVAFLIHTAEDEQADGNFNARPNVIHETGLFQGTLGFSKAIVVLEQGCLEYSNLYGIQQIRFSKGNIKEVFGDVLATIRRELGTI